MSDNLENYSHIAKDEVLEARTTIYPNEGGVIGFAEDITDDGFQIVLYDLDGRKQEPTPNSVTAWIGGDIAETYIKDGKLLARKTP